MYSEFLHGLLQALSSYAIICLHGIYKDIELSMFFTYCLTRCKLLSRNQRLKSSIKEQACTARKHGHCWCRISQCTEDWIVKYRGRFTHPFILREIKFDLTRNKNVQKECIKRLILCKRQNQSNCERRDMQMWRQWYEKNYQRLKGQWESESGEIISEKVSKRYESMKALTQKRTAKNGGKQSKQLKLQTSACSVYLSLMEVGRLLNSVKSDKVNTFIGKFTSIKCGGSEMICLVSDALLMCWDKKY